MNSDIDIEVFAILFRINQKKSNSIFKGVIIIRDVTVFVGI
jgi:hypothetical protein